MTIKSARIGFSFGLVLTTILGAAVLSCSTPKISPTGDPKLWFPGEKHLANIRQLTSGGTNAEAYWSFDGTHLSFQHGGIGIPNFNAPTEAERAAGPACDQIYTITVDGKKIQEVSNGKGRTTCAYYFPDNSRILFSSTHEAGAACPPEPDKSRGYVWPIYPSYQMYSAKPDGSELQPMEPGAPHAYNAEATVCKDGSVIFTSDRDGDLDLYVGKLDNFGTLRDIKRVTTLLGYDGGAFFSQDCKKIVWRASRPRPGKEADEYIGLLKQHLIRPGALELWVANADGSHAHQVTRINAASFAPFFTPDGNRIVFASNPRDPRGRSFDIYMINTNGTGLERVTYSNTFESFPMFSPDGKHLAFSSNRFASRPRETNLFIADWVETPTYAPSTEDADPANRFYAVVAKLSAPEMEGRGAGTEGFTKAARFVEEQYKAIGLKPFYETFKRAKGGQGYSQNVEVMIRKLKTVAKSENILATWGKGCGKVKPVLIGAHLDHLGHGSRSSLEASQEGIHPGADDNASGVAGVLEVARLIEAEGAKPDSGKKFEAQSCFIFAAFTGEEEGIAGSSRLAEMLQKSGITLKAMLNMDMIGRMENNKLTVFGPASAKEWSKLVEKECTERHLTCPGGGDGYGPSDHMAFYIHKTPVLHFFTGPHGDYHRVSDTADKINATGGMQAAEVVAALAIQAANPRQTFHYQKAKDVPMMGALRSQGEQKGNGAYLGTIPDYTSISDPHGPKGQGEPTGGIRLAGARTGSPAEKAGVKEGDVLVSIMDAAGAEHPINTLEEFMKVLTLLKPEDHVQLGIRRSGKALKLPAIVGKREAQ